MAQSGDETNATIAFRVLRAHCSLHTDVLWTASTKPGQGTAKFCHKLYISYHLCKFKIIVECFVFLNFKFNFMQSSILLNFNCNLNLK
jgi:hypothetical protein